jgi:parallel beta-helix repeat protein
MRALRPISLLIPAVMASVPLALLASSAPPAPVAVPSTVALASTITASSSNGPFVAANAGDGNQSTYWESTNNVFPQWIQADLGASVPTNRLVLKLPVANWGARTQTFSVQGSTNGTNFTDLVASAGHTFDPASQNTVTIDFGPATVRYIRLNITANTGWPAGQLSEFEVNGPSTGDTQPPTAPANLAFTEPASGQIRLTWTASTDNVGVTNYDVYANGNLRTSVAGTVLTYTDTQPTGTTVSYFVRARDAAGNQSPNSNTVTRSGGGGGGTNLAVGKPITANGHVFTFVETNANDDNVGTYWEGAGSSFPNLLTVSLGSNAVLSSVVVRLNPDPIWGRRTQNIEILGREQSSSAFTTIKAAADYVFDPASSNLVTIPVSATVADVRLRYNSNTGAPAGQAAEFQVIGVPAPNPDLTVTGMSRSPANPVETDAITLSATVRNAGDAASGPTSVNFYLGTTLAGSANVGGLAAGASTTVSASIGTRTAGSYQVSAKVDENNAVIEKNEANNAFTDSTQLVVTPVASSDLVGQVSWTPSNPAAGNTVTFSATVRNQGTVVSGGGAHGITLTVLNQSGATVATLNGSVSGMINPGATAGPVTLGTWTAANGRFTAHLVLANDVNELPVKQGNNISDTPLFVGRGANMPYDMYEAEDGTLGGGAAVVGPNRTIGDLAGEASGRKAVTLNSTGSFVEFTTRASTNTLVTRFSIPDGVNTTLNIYVDGTFSKAINLTSHFAWLYGAETSPNNSPSPGTQRHIYDEANVLLNSTVPAGHRIRLQKDATNTSSYAIDFINLEQVTQIANPDPARYAVPAGFAQQDVQNALDRVRNDTTGNLIGVYLPTGDYQTSSKFQVSGKPIRVIGAGPWFTRFLSPSGQENTDVGFAVQNTANGSTFANFAYFGNYTSRIDGPGKVFDLSNTSNMTIDNLWVEHQMVLYWGAHTSNNTITNNRIRDTFADGINMTNGSQNNRVANNEARSTGDDSFALFNAQDNGGGENTGNVFENLTSLVTWRAAGVAVYGGFNNTFRNIFIADPLVFSGITISSLDFGIPMNGFGANPPTSFQNISINRAGGHFFGNQTFPAIWMFSASKVYQGIRVSDVDIVDPTYSGIMFQTNYVGGQPQFPVADTVFTNISITGAQRSGDAFDAKSGFGLWANELPEPGQGPAVGSVTFNNLRMTNNSQNIKNTTTTFTITINP